MNTQRVNRIKISAAVALLCGLGLGAAPAARAQQPLQGTANPAQMAAGQNAGGINAATDVALDQKLDTQLTLDNTFRDETGRTVQLGEYFNKKKPVVLVMPFYKCPGICTQELNGMSDVFRDPKLRYKVGRDFDAVVVSINPKEKSDLAAMKKKEYLNQLGQPGAENGWHFLVGDEPNIKKLAGEIGFKYKYDAKTDNYAHPAGIIVITPQGKVSRYFYGVVYPAAQLRLGLTDSGQGHIGSPAEKVLLYCYHYDPQTGKYGPAIFRILQVAGFSTVLLVGTFMLMMFRREAKAGPGGLGGDPRLPEPKPRTEGEA
jgi:protein SCO1/2